MENFTEIINKIKTKEDFIKFVELLNIDFKENSEEWENKNIPDYLEALSRWTNDNMNGYYKYIDFPLPENIDWRIFADILMAAKMYE